MNDSHNDNLTHLLLVVPTLHQGGLETVCLRTARLLGPYFKITIAVFNLSDLAFDITGLDVVDLGIGAVPGKAGKALNVVKRVRALKKLKKDRRIEVSYSFGQTANLSNVLSGVGEKVICSIRSYMDFDVPKKIRLFCSRADLVVCCSKEIEEVIRTEYGCTRTVTISNPIHIPTEEELKAGRRLLAGASEEKRNRGYENTDGKLTRGNAGKKEAFAADAKYEAECGSGDAKLRAFLLAHDRLVMSMGRLDEVKGFWHQIKALSVIRREEEKDAGEEQQRTGLVLIGAGDASPYRKLAEDLGIAEHVYFTGVLRQPAALLSLADLYALTSIYEGFPNALLEAMAVGVPVLATDCHSGPREILAPSADDYNDKTKVPEGEYGVLIPQVDPVMNYDASYITEEEKELAAKMRTMLRDREAMKEAGAKGRARAADFSEEAYIENLKKIFE